MAISKLVMASILLILAGCGWFFHHPTPPDDQAFIWTVKLNQAQRRFYQENKRYGQLAELGPDGVGFIPGQIAKGEHVGYRFSLKINGDRYSLRVFPKQLSRYTERSFYTDQTGIVRQSSGAEPASENSKPVE